MGIELCEGCLRLDPGNGRFTDVCELPVCSAYVGALQGIVAYFSIR